MSGHHAVRIHQLSCGMRHHGEGYATSDPFVHDIRFA